MPRDLKPGDVARVLPTYPNRHYEYNVGDLVKVLMIGTFGVYICQLKDASPIFFYRSELMLCHKGSNE